MGLWESCIIICFHPCDRILEISRSLNWAMLCVHRIWFEIIHNGIWDLKYLWNVVMHNIFSLWMEPSQRPMNYSCKNTTLICWSVGLSFSCASQYTWIPCRDLVGFAYYVLMACTYVVCLECVKCIILKFPCFNVAEVHIATNIIIQLIQPTK